MDRSMGASGLRHLLLAVGIGIASPTSIAPAQAQEMCGGTTYPFPYTDVASVGGAFCPGIMEAYVTGVSKGTTPTTFSPSETVTRVQMTTFLQRSLDQGLTRSSRRAGLNKWWTTQSFGAMRSIGVGGFPTHCDVDGENIWTSTGGAVVQVQASTGSILGTWTLTNGNAVLVAAGNVYVAALGSPGNLYVIDPTAPPGPAPLASSSLGDNPLALAFDGTTLWTTNSSGGSVSIITVPLYAVTTVSAGFTQPWGILYDGAHIWVTDYGAGTLLKLDPSGNILQTVTVGAGPQYPAFDGANIWVPNAKDNSITVVQASSGKVVATITADASNLLDYPMAVSFDGERVLVANENGTSVTVFKAADLSLIANVAIPGNQVYGACSDGVNFWLPIVNTGTLRKF